MIQRTNHVRKSYRIDLEDQKNSTNSEFYRNIRAACESGWDFSSRWFSDNENLKTINTLNILPVRSKLSFMASGKYLVKNKLQI
ncbi:trehalase family glycosidase [Halpernia sp. GG3]